MFASVAALWSKSFGQVVQSYTFKTLLKAHQYGNMVKTNLLKCLVFLQL